MRFSILPTVQSAHPTLSTVDVSARELAALWQSGARVGPILKPSRNAGHSFAGAEALIVRIALDRLPLAIALSAEFTQRHCTVAVHNPGAERPELLLAFGLPAAVSKPRTYTALLSGLETLYAGAVSHAGAEQLYGLPAGTEATVLDQRLDAAAITYLEQLGADGKALVKANGGLVRSRVQIDRTASLRLEGGDEIALEQLPPDTTVYCPVHVDRQPAAFVHWFQDGTPGVQCMYCKRTFSAPNARHSYDFDRFDHTIRELAEIPAAAVDVGAGVLVQDPDITYLSEPYLPALTLQEGAQFVKSPKGTGKTERLVEIVAFCKRQHLGVLLLGHRRSLIQTMAARLGIQAYFMVDDTLPQPANRQLLGFERPLRAAAGPQTQSDDTKREGPLYRSVEPTRRYAVCLDSLEKLDPTDRDRQYEVVIIDEAEQVFSHLIGSTLKERRREVYALLSYYARTAPYVMFLDADLNLITVDAACSLLKPTTPVHFLINTPSRRSESVYMYANKAQLTMELIKRVRQGEKTFIATNSKKKAIEIELTLAQHSPKSRIAVITSDNSQDLEIQRLISDLPGRFEADLDVLIASPAIGTGVDITFKDEGGQPRTVVKNVFGFFEQNITTHFDIDQQLMRVRHPGQVHVWVSMVPMYYETDVSCVKRELAHSVRHTGYLLRYDDDGKPIFAGDEGLIDIWARVLAASRGSKNKLNELFRALRVENGWTLVAVDLDEDAAAAGRVVLQAAKEERQRQRETRLINAAALDPDDWEELMQRDKRGEHLTDAERDAIERYRIEKFYLADISSELLNFDDDGHTRPAIVRLECLVVNRAWFENEDDKEREHVAFDRKHMLAQRGVLERALVSTSLFNAETRTFNLTARVDKESLAPFVRALDADRKQFESLFGTPLNADIARNPVSQLRRVLGLVGLKLGSAEVDQSGGKKLRSYSIDAERLSTLMETVALRDTKYERDSCRSGIEDRVANAKANSTGANRPGEKIKASLARKKMQAAWQAPAATRS